MIMKMRRQDEGGVWQAAPPYDTLRELHLRHCELTADDAANLAPVARRLRVLHLDG